MPQIARLIGGAGTGKTTALLDLIDQVIGSGIHPLQIGFITFTRAAREEAAERAIDRFNIDRQEFRHKGWFRTLHALTYKCVGISRGYLLTEDDRSREWLSGALGATVVSKERLDDESLSEYRFDGSEVGIALNLWSTSRNRMADFRDVWLTAYHQDPRIPGLDFCCRLIERYELFKRTDHMADFTDLLALFAGIEFTLKGHRTVAPVGDVPELPVWFFDEQQDTSPLLDQVCRRLIDQPWVKWAYVVGDPFQAIYGWAGADHKLFLNWKADTEKVMPKSYRCPAPMMDLGEHILQGCSDYFSRDIKPADHDGRIETAWELHSVADIVDPREEWLVIARTGIHASRLAKALDRHNIPWVFTRGGGGWHAPAKIEYIRACLKLTRNEPITNEDWYQLVKTLPVKHFERGVKSRYRVKSSVDELSPEIWPQGLRALGAKDSLREIIKSGGWSDVLPGGDRYIQAIHRYGESVFEDIRIKVGTIHSVKGKESDNVLLLTSTSQPVARAEEGVEGADEERRVQYVAVSRARHSLTILQERGASYRMASLS